MIRRVFQLSRLSRLFATIPKGKSRPPSTSSPPEEPEPLRRLECSRTGRCECAESATPKEQEAIRRLQKTWKRILAENKKYDEERKKAEEEADRERNERYERFTNSK